LLAYRRLLWESSRHLAPQACSLRAVSQKR
jgi:hypothetical protein